MKKRYITVNEFEQGLLINALMQFRSDLLTAGNPTEDINDLILKSVDAPAKKRWR